MKDITCVIVDDEPFARSLLEGYIKKTKGLELAAKYSNPLEALNSFRESIPDLLFLDIEMPELDGMKFPELLEDCPAIIFTTAYSAYAVESYEKDAIDYLLKPITYERFLRAVRKSRMILRENRSDAPPGTGQIFLKSGSKYIAVRYDEIYFIEGLGDYVTFHTAGENVIVYHTFKKLGDLLPEQFVRTHYSYIVNFDHVEKIENSELNIRNRKIPISKSYKKKVMEKVENGLI